MKKLAKSLKMELIEIPKSSVLVIQGYLQLVGIDWGGYHAARYYTYVIAKRCIGEFLMQLHMMYYLDKDLGCVSMR